MLANTKCVSDDINGFTFSSYVKYREQQHKEIEKVIDLLNEKRINYLFLKGIVLENYYPETTSRQYQDYDLIIESINEFANIHTELEDLGFEHDYIPVLAEVNGKVVGLIKLSKKINEGNYIKLEINIGGFPITDVTTLPSSEIWEDSMTIVWRNKEIKVPSTDISMFILLIEMTGNKQKRIRDLVLSFEKMCRYG
ncbi:nucleotidyltransferase family protein [Alkalihalobacillus sp. LMS39]|uniref:nucleotidyltransferase family protein n=1 Tax=Alkalihalobacillus sp. LMS39 TaxID=2924032 RepID=UPI001FB3FC19|nr:nucleotidyltransferase family protein [Alkalihalobacillus sp. LMS39]UOE95082.1 nucleotidyltransferase family protein [Alkalihalobacillus sp. LMS39]